MAIAQVDEQKAKIDACRVRQRLIRELVQRLVDLHAFGMALVVRMSVVAAYRKKHGRAALPVDINRAFDLVMRAFSWIRALEIRLAADAVAARAALNAAKGWPDPPERLDDGEDWNENFGPPRKRCERVEPADIGRTPTAEVFAQIIADLTEAAVLLGDDAKALRLKEIGEAVRALLGGPDETWRPLPIYDAAEDVAGSPAPEVVLAPGTG